MVYYISFCIFYFIELEWRLSTLGAVKTTLDANPRKQVQDVMATSIRQATVNDDSDSDYWGDI